MCLDFGWNPKKERSKMIIQKKEYTIVRELESFIAKVYYKILVARKGKVWIKVAKEDIEDSSELIRRDFEMMMELKDLKETVKLCKTSLEPPSGIPVIITKPYGITLSLLAEYFLHLKNQENNTKPFDPKEISLKGLMHQMLECVQALHDKGIIHGGITPSSFVFGRKTDQKDQLFIQDFAFTSKVNIQDKDSNQTQVPYSSLDPCFISIDMGFGIKASFKDDMESCFYVLLAVVNKVPWRDISSSVRTREQHKDLADIKTIDTNPEILKIDAENSSEATKIPEQVIDVFRRIRILDRNERLKHTVLLRLKESRGGRMDRPAIKWTKLLQDDKKMKK